MSHPSLFLVYSYVTHLPIGTMLLLHCTDFDELHFDFSLIQKFENFLGIFPFTYMFLQNVLFKL